jgi:hypothetical protein
MRVQGFSGFKLIAPAFLLACVVGIGPALLAQEQETGKNTTTRTKITIKDGKDIKATGCVTRAETGALMLTGVADKRGALPDYVLVLDDEKEQDLAKHVGHQVEVSGKAANQGDGKVKFEVEEKTKPTGTSGDEHKTERSAEMSGNLKLPLLGVKSFKMLAAACR